ncbi:MAG: NAD(+) synthase [Thermoanaerobacterales bacterium]|nr:NAD(+) synthase [Thermoanaerobacterales bacterium]
MAERELAAKLTEWLDKQLRAAGAEGFVVGLSGGIDSAVAAALCQRARPERTLGIIMPCHSDPRDAEDARLLAETLGIPYKTIVLDDVFEQFLKVLCGETYDPAGCDLTIANIKPRLRMTTLYFHAARRRSLVVGTSNRSELMVGYFTKYGDGGADLLPLANLVKGEVYTLASALGVPQRIIERKPSAGLWRNQCDETELGVTYRELDDYLLLGKGSPRAREIIEGWIAKSEHKRMMPLIPPV